MPEYTCSICGSTFTSEAKTPRHSCGAEFGNRKGQALKESKDGQTKVLSEDMDLSAADKPQALLPELESDPTTHGTPNENPPPTGQKTVTKTTTTTPAPPTPPIKLAGTKATKQSLSAMIKALYAITTPEPLTVAQEQEIVTELLTPVIAIEANMSTMTIKGEHMVYISLALVAALVIKRKFFGGPDMTAKEPPMSK